MSVRATVHAVVILAAALCAGVAEAADKPFHLQETSIAEIHRGIQAGEVSCKQVVEAYAARAKAYNGVCTALISADGAKVPSVAGTVRGGAALKFPTDTVAISKLIPDFGQYKGLKPD